MGSRKCVCVSFFLCVCACAILSMHVNYPIKRFFHCELNIQVLQIPFHDESIVYTWVCVSFFERSFQLKLGVSLKVVSAKNNDRTFCFQGCTYVLHFCMENDRFAAGLWIPNRVATGKTYPWIHMSIQRCHQSASVI